MHKMVQPAYTECLTGFCIFMPIGFLKFFHLLVLGRTALAAQSIVPIDTHFSVVCPYLNHATDLDAIWEVHPRVQHCVRWGPSPLQEVDI